MLKSPQGGKSYEKMDSASGRGRTVDFRSGRSAPEAKTETLEGKGNGFGGLITVTVTRKDGKITDVKAIGDQETQGIGSQAIEQLPQAIVKANSTDVDNVSGATFSSQGNQGRGQQCAGSASLSVCRKGGKGRKSRRKSRHPIFIRGWPSYPTVA